MAACHPSQIVCPQEGQRGLQAWRVAWVLRCGCEASRRGAVKAREAGRGARRVRRERRKPSGSVITIRIGADLWRASGTALHISLDKTRLPHRRNQDFHFWIFTVPSEQKFPHNFANAPIKGTTNVRQVMVAEWARLTEAEMVSPQSSGKTTRSGAQTSSSAPQPKVLFRP
jgi:hypothetical protein